MYCCRWDIRRSWGCHRWLGPNRQWYSGTRGLTVCNCGDPGQRSLLPTVGPQFPPNSWQPGVHRGGQCSNLWGKAASIIHGHACPVSSSCSSMATAISNCTDLDPQVTTILLCVCPTYQDHILSSTQHSTVCYFIQYQLIFHTTYNTRFLHKLTPDWLITTGTSKTVRYCVSHTYVNGNIRIIPLAFSLTSYRTVNTVSISSYHTACLQPDLIPHGQHSLNIIISYRLPSAWPHTAQSTQSQYHHIVPLAFSLTSYCTVNTVSIS
jgi:hypothetical protein